MWQRPLSWRGHWPGRIKKQDKLCSPCNVVQARCLAKFGRDIQVRDQSRQRSVRRSRLPRCSLRPSLILCCGIAPFSRTPRQPRRIDRSAVPPCHPATGRVRAQREPVHRTSHCLRCRFTRAVLVPRLDATIPPRRRVFPYRHHTSRRFLHQHARHCRRRAINVKRIFLPPHFVARDHLHNSPRSALVSRW